MEQPDKQTFWNVAPLDSNMDDQPAPRTLRDKLLGYYAVPHELLHVVAYRLIGKPYQLLLIYSGTSRLDLLMAYHLLFGKDQPQDQRPHPHRKSQNKSDQGHQP